MKSMYIANFAKHLKELMGEMTVTELSLKVGIPQATISRYLLEQREITVSNLCKIADYFHEDIDVLLGRREY